MPKNTEQNAPAGYLSIADAVKHSGLARSTVYQYIAAGKISVSIVNHRGRERKFIQAAEVLRVFGEPSTGQSETTREKHERTPPPDTSELIRLRTENEGLRAILSEVREARANAERDKERLAQLLADSMATVKLLEAKTAPAQAEKKKGLIGRLMGAVRG